MKRKTVFIVLTDDPTKRECDCCRESVNSVWLDKKRAEEKAKTVYLVRVISMEIEDSQFVSLI